MQNFTLVLLICVVVSDYIVKLLSLPSLLRFIPDILSALIVVYVFVVGTRDRFASVAPKYWLAFGAFALILLCGVLVNEPSAGPLLSAMRFYLRAVPLFFLAAVLPMDETVFARQLKWLLGLGVLQIPISLYQRWVIQSEGRFSGDDVKGTVLDSGVLTIFLICIVVVLTAFVLRKRIGKLAYAVLALALLIPTTINETKVGVFYLPVGLLVTVFLGAERGKRVRYMGIAATGIVLFAALFVPVYNMTQVNNPFKNEKDITDLFTSEKLFKRYMTSDVGGLGTKKDVRRGDAIIVPYRYLEQDPVHLMFGLGMGAVSPSNLGKNFEGPYYELFSKFLITSFTFFLLEFGLFGIAMIAVLLWMVFGDAWRVARRDRSLTGDFAIGWTAIVLLFGLNFFYTIFHEFSSLTYLYWYFSGLVCTRARMLSAPAGAGFARRLEV